MPIKQQIEDIVSYPVIPLLQLTEMTSVEIEGKQKLVFLCPSRGLIGFRSAFATLTKGSGLMHRAFVEYGPFRGATDRVRKGVLVSMAGTWPLNPLRLYTIFCVKGLA